MQAQRTREIYLLIIKHETFLTQFVKVEKPGAIDKIMKSEGNFSTSSFLKEINREKHFCWQ